MNKSNLRTLANRLLVCALFAAGVMVLYHVAVVMPRQLEPGPMGYIIVGVLTFIGMFALETIGCFRKGSK
jgi:predicted membrane chloride channel (bestrophin family)